MPVSEHVLCVAIYASVEEAGLDLRELTGPSGFAESVGGSGLLHRGTGRVTLQQAGGGTLGYGIGTGAAVGIVAGVILGYPLVVGGIGAVVGGIIGYRNRTREVDGLVRVLDDAIPVGATALVAVVRAEAWPVLRGTLDRALRVSGWPLDDGPLVPFARSLVRGNPTATEDLGGHAPPEAPSGLRDGS